MTRILRITLRLPEPLHARLVAQAKDEGRTLHGLILAILSGKVSPRTK